MSDETIYMGNTQNEEMIVVGLVCRIFKLKTFVADMPDIAVAAVRTVCRERKVDSVLTAVLDLGFT